MNEYLKPGRFVDSDHPDVVDFSRKKARGEDSREKAVSLYYAVRDRIRYNPFQNFMLDETYRGSLCVERGVGWCVPKAALLGERWRGAFAGDVPMRGTNHFSVVDGLADHSSALFQGVRKLMKLDR